ncbi:MAG TPA: nitrous oxide reductase accessory protein NosL [Bacteroidia bacterium]|nr:nitrous oxide reductase accessory protein NosL [Bacteroidia bacterium]
MKSSKILMLVASLMLLLLFVFPLWNISLEAPQYPDPIGMNIYIHKITDEEPNDIQNINLMNHYVGMKPIPEDLPEFHVFPAVILTMSALGILVALFGNYKLIITWLIVMVILGAAGIYDFYLWEYDYGHHLSEHAAIKFTDEEGHPLAYQPPLIGEKKILNFIARSYPISGAYILFTALVFSFIAFLIEVRSNKNNRKKISKETPKKGMLEEIVVLILIIFFLSSCSNKPQPINFGNDECSYCKMTIVDKLHAAEYVSDKGKVYKYDTIECLIHDMKEKNFPPHSYLLVSDYSEDGKFIDAENAVYLVSKNIPSPMGAFLSAFSDKQKAEEIKKEKEGNIYLWKEIIQKIDEEEE